MLYRISVAERSLTGIAKIFRSRLSRLDDLLRALTVPLTLARIRCFTTFGRTGGCDPPPFWRFSRLVYSRLAYRVLAIGGIIFGPRSIFDPVMAGQRSNFRKFYDFST